MRRFLGAILCITKTLKFNDFKQQTSLVTSWSSWTGWAWSLTVFTWWFTQLGLGVLHGLKQLLVFTRLRHRSSQVYRGDCVSPCGLSHFWRSGLASSHSGREGKYTEGVFQISLTSITDVLSIKSPKAKVGIPGVISRLGTISAM